MINCKKKQTDSFCDPSQKIKQTDCHLLGCISELRDNLKCTDIHNYISSCLMESLIHPQTPRGQGPPALRRLNKGTEQLRMNPLLTEQSPCLSEALIHLHHLRSLPENRGSWLGKKLLETVGLALLLLLGPAGNRQVKIWRQWSSLCQNEAAAFSSSWRLLLSLAHGACCSLQLMDAF